MKLFNISQQSSITAGHDPRCPFHFKAFHFKTSNFILYLHERKHDPWMGTEICKGIAHTYIYIYTLYKDSPNTGTILIAILQLNFVNN